MIRHDDDFENPEVVLIGWIERVFCQVEVESRTN